MLEREGKEHAAPPAGEGTTRAAAEAADATRSGQAHRHERSPNEISETTVEEIAADAESRARPER